MFDNLKADISRLRRHGDRRPLPWLLLFEQGVWALLCYRAGNHLQRRRLPPGLHQVVMFVIGNRPSRFGLCTLRSPVTTGA